MTGESSGDRQAAFQRVAWGMVALAAFLALTGLWRAWPDTIDDAHISFRYVDNFLDGHGLSFNPGDRVEGYSNPLLVFLCIPASAVGVPPAWTARLLGFGGYVLCVVGAGALVLLAGGERWMAWAARGAVIGCFPLLYYSVTGLETGLMAGLIVAGVWRFEARGGRIDCLGAAIWSAAALSRPEGILYPFLLGIHELVRAFKARGGEDFKERWQSVAWALGIGLVFGLFVLWRRWYFGEWLPNTFHAKPPGTADLKPGGSFPGASWNAFGDFLLLGGVALPLLGLLTLRKEFFARVRPLWLIALAGLAFGLYTGGDWMPGSRYFLPVQVPVVVLGVLGLGELGRILEGKSSLLLQGMLAGAVLLGALAVPTALQAEFWLCRGEYPYHVMQGDPCQEMGEKLRARYGEDERLATHRIGAVGRFSGMFVIDLYGLVDPEVARAMGNLEEYSPTARWGDNVPAVREVIIERDPTLLLVTMPPEKRLIPPRREAYGMTFEKQFVHRLGEDQVWVCYKRMQTDE